MAKQAALGFWRGFSSVFGGAATLLRTPRAWPFACVPPALFLVLVAIIVSSAWTYLRPQIVGAVEGAAWLRWLYFDALKNIAPEIASALGMLITAVIGWRLAMPLASTLGAPALERLVGFAEAELQAPPREPLGFFAELWCGARSMLLGLGLTLPLEVVLWVLELVVPPLAPITTPLKFLLGALGVAWGLFDYPLTLRGMRARDRFAFMTKHLSVVLGFGVAFAALNLLPCCGLLMLPVGAIAATRLYWQLERAAAAAVSA
jgi:uncharacterized protein involved in cysteine biosynthesis